MAEGQRIGFIGLGPMGRGMATRLLAAGHELQVRGGRDRAPVEAMLAQGATEAASPAAMAGWAEVIHLCLPNSTTVEAVFRGPDGLLAGARPGLVVIDTTTADPTSTERLAAEAAAQGVTLVDAPLGRTPREAEAGTLDAMVGADAETFARILPVLQCWAGNITHCGPTGSGHRMKLIMNLVSMGYAALYAEALTIGTRAGLTPQVMHRVLGSSRLSNGFYETFMKGAIGGEPEIHRFSIANAAKDMRYADAMANAAGVANPMGSAIKNYFASAEAAGKAQGYVPSMAAHIAGLNGLDLAAALAAGATD